MNEHADHRHDDRDPDAERIDAAALDWLLLMRLGEPDAADRSRFDAWRAADPRHRRAFDEHREHWNSIDDLKPAFARTDPTTVGTAEQPASVSAWPRPTRGKTENRTGRTVLQRAVKAVALAAACLALAMFAGPELLLKARTDYRTAPGEQAQVELADGSIALLNTDTAISVDFTATGRDIRLLQGEVQFTVAKDPERPFRVAAQGGSATALGTVFATRDDGNGATVTVAEGRVNVTSPGKDNGEPAAKDGSVDLSAGHQVRYLQGQSPGPLRHVDPNFELAWREGFIVIDSQPLEAALAEIDRYWPGRLILMADTDGMDPVSATIPVKSITNGLDAILAVNGLNATHLIQDYIVIH